MIIEIVPVLLMFACGFLFCKTIFSIDEMTSAEKIAIWFCFGLLIAILNTFVLGLIKLLSYLPLIFVAQLSILIATMLIKQKERANFSFHIKPTYAFLLVLMCASFLVACSGTVDFVRNSDEYKNAFWGKTMMENNILAAGSLGREGFGAFPAKNVLQCWAWLQRYVYGLSLVYSFQVGGFSLLTGQVLSALFYSMLVLATFLLGGIKSERTGLLAAAFIAFNPMIYVFSNHPMTDIPSSSLAIFSLYFFIKSYEMERVDKRLFFIAFLFTGLAIFTKPTVIFIYPLISLYAFKKRKSVNKIEWLWRLFPLLIFLTGFIVDWIRCFLIQHSNPSWNIFIDASAPFTFSLNDWTDYLFTSPKGAYGTFIFPYIYTYGILLLTLLGILNILVKERNSLNMTFLGICIFTLWIFTTSTFMGGTARRIAIILPITMYFAAIGIQSRNYLSLSLIPFFFFLINIPEQGYVPYIQYTSLPEYFRLIIKLAGVAVVCLKIAEWLLQKHISCMRRIKIKVRTAIEQHILKLEFSDILMTAILLVTISASIFSGVFYKNNGPPEINETITIETVGIEQAVTWIDENVPSGSKIATNIVFEFPFYLSYLSPKNYTIINIPGTYQYTPEKAHDLFLNRTLNGEAEYLIIFTSMGYWEWYPYLEKYLRARAGMYEIQRSDTFVIYKVS